MGIVTNVKTYVSNLMPDKQDISSLIPHGPGMSLIDEIVQWDQKNLCARTMSHTAPDNLLRGSNGLRCVHTVEYAAQCMAVHGALNAADHGTRPMVVGALKNVRLSDVRLDTLTSPLIIQVTIAVTGNAGAIYKFSVHHQDISIASGRVTLLATPTTGATIPIFKPEC